MANVHVQEAIEGKHKGDNADILTAQHSLGKKSSGYWQDVIHSVRKELGDSYAFIVMGGTMSNPYKKRVWKAGIFRLQPFIKAGLFGTL